MTQRTRVEVRIGRLVLHGLPEAATQSFAEGLRAELERRLALPFVVDPLVGGATVERLEAGSFVVGSGDASDSLGAQAGARVAESLSR